MRPLTPLCQMARKYGTDKGGRHTLAGETCHEYTPIYWDLFGHRRASVKRVLEIGVHYGPSVRMWHEFFPNAEIVGLDSNAAALFHFDRIHCYAADQGREDSLMAALIAAGGRLTEDGKVEAQEFDLIIDDGSHEEAHQILSAQVLLPFLADDGHYVVEDMTADCQPNRIAFPVLQWVNYDMDGGVYDGLRYDAKSFVCEPGIGKAMCGCGYITNGPSCGAPESLLTFRRGRPRE